MSYKHLLLGLLVSSIALSFIFNTLTSAIIILVLGASYCLESYLESKKEPIANKELKDKLTLLEDRLAKSETKLSAFALKRI